MCSVIYVSHHFQASFISYLCECPKSPPMASGGGSLFKHLLKWVSCGYEAYMYIVQSEILCGRGKGHPVCVLVVMISISLR